MAWVKVNQLETSLDDHGNFLKDIPIQLGINTIRVEAADSLGNHTQISIDIEGEKYALPPCPGLNPPPRGKRSTADRLL